MNDPHGRAGENTHACTNGDYVDVVITMPGVGYPLSVFDAQLPRLRHKASVQARAVLDVVADTPTLDHVELLQQVLDPTGDRVVQVRFRTIHRYFSLIGSPA